MSLEQVLKSQVVAAKTVTVTFEGQTFSVAETWLKSSEM